MARSGFIAPPPGMFEGVPASGEPGANRSAGTSPAAAVDQSPQTQAASPAETPIAQPTLPQPAMQHAPSPSDVPEPAPAGGYDYSQHPEFESTTTPNESRPQADSAAPPADSWAPATPAWANQPEAQASVEAHPPAQQEAPAESYAFSISRGEYPPFPRLDPTALPDASGITSSGGEARSAGATGAWTLQLMDGQVVQLRNRVILGRDPVVAEDTDAQIVSLSDGTRTVSKTHAQISVVGDALLIDDLRSTNGVAVCPGGSIEAAVAVEPGHSTQARAGDTVQLGDYVVRIGRAR